MLTTVEGIYQKGHVELRERPENVPEESRVIVTFLSAGEIASCARGIGEEQARDLRQRLATFAGEWESPEMDVHDDYDAASIVSGRAPQSRRSSRSRPARSRRPQSC